MIQLLSLLVSLLVSVAHAQAAEPSVSTMIEACRAQYTSKAAVAQCVTEARFAQGERRDQDLATSFAYASRQSEERDREILERVDRLSESVEALRPQATTRPASTQPQATAPQGVTLTQTGVAYAEIPQIAVMSIYPQFEGVERDTLHVTALAGNSSRSRCGGQGADMVIVTNHGVPVSDMWVPPGQEVLGFTEVYYDHNSDGTPDGTVWALDLSQQTDVYVTWRYGDEFGLRYIRAEKIIAIPGLGPQTVYRPTVMGKDPVSAQACRRDTLASPGGHQSIPTHNLVRIYRQ